MDFFMIVSIANVSKNQHCHLCDTIVHKVKLAKHLKSIKRFLKCADDTECDKCGKLYDTFDTEKQVTKKKQDNTC